MKIKLKIKIDKPEFDKLQPEELVLWDDNDEGKLCSYDVKRKYYLLIALFKVLVVVDDCSFSLTRED